MSTSTRSQFHHHAATWWLTFVIVLVAAMVVLLFLPRAASAQGIGFAGDDPQKYGDMYRTYQREHNQALQDLDDEVAAILRQGNSPGHNQQAIEKAYGRFMERSGKLDARYRQPVLQKMLDVANLRVADFVKTTPVDPQSTGHVDPSRPITPSKGTQPGQPGYRQGLSDTDAAGGARAIDHLTGIAREMGLTPDDSARLFELKAGYSTTTDDSLLLTAHKSGRLDRVGSNAWQTQIEVDARSKETSLHVNMQPDQAGRDYVAVRDHQRKALDGLQTPGAELLPEPGQGTNLKGAEKLQGMVKGTLKSLDTAGLSDEVLARLIQKHGIGGSPAKLRNVLGLLKGGRAIIPESVGLTTENIEKFKALCGDIIDESAQVTKAKANAELQDRLAQRDQLEATGDKADRDRARKIREEIIDSRKRMQEVERAVVQNEIDDLQKQRDSVVAPTDDGQTKTPNDPETEAARKRKLAEIDREIDARRVKQAVRDLYSDVERRKTVSGTTVVNDLERPRRPRPLPPEFTRRPPTKVPTTQDESVLTHPAVNRGLFVAGGLIATYEALKEEYYEAEKRLREKLKGTPDEDRPLTNREILAEVSYTRATARTALSLTGIEGAWLAGQKAKYEWVKGTNDYIEGLVDRYHAAGFDELPLVASLTIMIKATIRQTSLSLYQGAKGVPIIGDLVGFPENLFVLTEAGIGALYDPWKADQLEKYQVQRGERNAAQATLTVEPLVRHIENLATAAALQVRTLESLDQSSREADIEAEKLRDRFRADIQALEKLLEKIGAEVETPVVVPDVAVLERLFEDITTLTREATEFSLRCDRLERDLKGGKIECSTIREQDQELSVELVNQGLSRGLIQEKYASLEQTLQKLGPTADARRIVLRLQETADYAGRLSENLSRTSRQIPQLVGNHRVLRENQELLRERVLHYCDFFQPRAAPGSDTQEWADYRRRVDAARIDMALFKNAAAIGRRFDVTAQHLELIARTELLELPIAMQPRRADGQLAGDLQNLKQPLAAMTVALEKAIDKLDGLRQLCPAPKPAFEITAKVGDGLRVQFEVTGKTLAAAAKRFFVWDFGDASRETFQQPTCTHSFPKPGTYDVEVRVFEEKENFSADLGVASTTVTLKGSSSTPRSSPPAGSAVTALGVTPELTIAGALVPPEEGVYLGKLKPGQYLAGGMLHIQLLPGGREITYEFNISVEVKLSDQHYKGPAGLRGFVPPFWRLNVVGNGRGDIDPQSGRFQGSSEDANWTENISGVEREGGRAEGRQLIGMAPEELPWNGRIEGTVDWKTFRGGQGQLEINRLVRGTWKHASGKPYDVKLPADIEANGRQPTLRLFPNEVSCQRSYDALYRGPFGGYRKPLPDIGDRAIWTQSKGILAQFGRWQLTMQGYPFMHGTPDRFLPLMQKVEKFIPASGWESSIPEQQD